MVTKFPMIGK